MVRDYSVGWACRQGCMENQAGLSQSRHCERSAAAACPEPAEGQNLGVAPGDPSTLLRVTRAACQETLQHPWRTRTFDKRLEPVIMRRKMNSEFRSDHSVSSTPRGSAMYSPVDCPYSCPGSSYRRNHTNSQGAFSTDLLFGAICFVAS